MPQNTTGELRKVKQQLAECRRALNEAQAFNERLRSLIGYEELKGWQPQQRIERQYGWVYAWLYPLDSFLNQRLSSPLTPDVRNEVHDIVVAIIAQMAVQGKYGVKLPYDPRPVDIEQFLRNQDHTFQRSYEPCVICGENRVTHACHILPRADGGPFHKLDIGENHFNNPIGPFARCRWECVQK
jgi:hypothetical protein